MLSNMGTLPVLYFLLVLLAFPPAICLWTAFRKFARARDRRRPTALWKAFIAFGALALAFNLSILTPTAQLALDGLGFEFGVQHIVALGISWLSIWVWFIMGFLMKRRRLAY
jgi:hypothetical protein